MYKMYTQLYSENLEVKATCLWYPYVVDILLDLGEMEHAVVDWIQSTQGGTQ
jgi:hypothetical protein